MGAELMTLDRIAVDISPSLVSERRDGCDRWHPNVPRVTAVARGAEEIAGVKRRRDDWHFTFRSNPLCHRVVRCWEEMFDYPSGVRRWPRVGQFSAGAGADRRAG
jgi:hypothetical protein